MSPDGRFVVCSSGRTSYLFDGGTGRVVALPFYTEDPAVSLDARVIAFVGPPGLSLHGVADDVGIWSQVYAYLRDQGKIEVISQNSQGVPGNNESFDPSISHDGGYVAFVSAAANLVANDQNKMQDVFIRIRSAERTVRASIGPEQEESNDISYQPSVSPDGDTIVFQTQATNWGTESSDAVFCYLRLVREEKTVPIRLRGPASRAYHLSRRSSAVLNGSYEIVYLPSDSQDSGIRLCSVDVRNGTVRCKPIAAFKPQLKLGIGIKPKAHASSNGRYVAFTARNLTQPGPQQVVVVDWIEETLEYVSVNEKGQLADADAENPQISEDGHWIMFESAAMNLWPNSTEKVDHVYVAENPLWRRKE